LTIVVRNRARLAAAAMDEELVLERTAHAVGVAEVVDRRAARAEPGGQRLAHAVARAPRTARA
jgi:hypothetical protein